MDDTPTHDPISELKEVDPADSPDVADRIADELAAELDGDESSEVEVATDSDGETETEAETPPEEKL